jgi:hypothetical protein
MRLVSYAPPGLDSNLTSPTASPWATSYRSSGAFICSAGVSPASILPIKNRTPTKREILKLAN